MEEREKKNYLSMFNGQRGAERNPKNFQRRDDGSHIYTKCDDYYEWWYFDASFENGYHAVVTYHYHNAWLKPMIPTIQLMIYKPDGTQVSKYTGCNPDQIYAGPEYCDVMMSDSWVKDTGNGYEVYMVIRGVGMHLTFKNMVPSWKPGTGLLYMNEEKRLVQGWVVPIPHAEVEGELYVKDETIPVKGTGYHDHNWGTVRFHEIIDDWYWGRIHNKEYTIVYGWVRPRDKEAPVIAPLLIAKNNEIILSTDDMHTQLDDIVPDERTGKEYAKKITITAKTKNVNLLLTMNTKRVIEFMQMPKIVEWNQYYYRFLADYVIDLEIDGAKDKVKGELLHEYMVL